MFLIIAISLFIICLIILASYILYSRMNELRDYFVNKLYHNEIYTKEKFENINNVIDNFFKNKNTVVEKENVEEENEQKIIEELYNELKNEKSLSDSDDIKEEIDVVKKDFQNFIKDDKFVLEDIEEEDEEEDEEEPEPEEDSDEESEEDLEEDEESEEDEDSEEDINIVFEENIEEEKDSEEDIDVVFEENIEEEKEECCDYEFKRGKNKGNKCGEKIFENGKCKKHK
jgi:hypothetical protein